LSASRDGNTLNHQEIIHQLEAIKLFSIHADTKNSTSMKYLRQLFMNIVSAMRRASIINNIIANSIIYLNFWQLIVVVNNYESREFKRNFIWSS
jgi:hypothetical protein